MATNQILDYNDEILDGTPRYNITDNGDGTKGIELANDIVQEGTLINRNTFNKISNVLSYLTPSVEKVELAPTPYLKNMFFKSSDVVNQSNNNTYTANLETLYGDITPTIEYNVYGILYNSTTRKTTWTNQEMQGVFNNTDINVTNLAYQLTPGNYVLVDFKKKVNATLKIRVGTANKIRVYGSNDGITYDIIETISDISVKEIVINDYRYVKIDDYASSGGSYIYYSYFEIEDYKLNFQNQFTLDNNGTTFVNNQRVLVETSKSQTEMFNSLKGSWESDTTNLIATSTFNNKTITATATNFKTTDSYTITNVLNGITDYTYSPKNENSNIVFDLGNTYNLSKIKLWTYIAGTITDSSITVYAGTSLTNLNSIINISPSVNVLTKYTFPQQNVRYIKIDFQNVNSGSYSYFRGIEVPEILTDGMSLDGVTSNTLNGIDIPTILQPSTKYELIYNEDSNKFELNSKDYVVNGINEFYVNLAHGTYMISTFPNAVNMQIIDKDGQGIGVSAFSSQGALFSFDGTRIIINKGGASANTVVINFNEFSHLKFTTALTGTIRITKIGGAF